MKNIDWLRDLRWQILRFEKIISGKVGGPKKKILTSFAYLFNVYTVCFGRQFQPLFVTQLFYVKFIYSEKGTKFEVCNLIIVFDITY